MLRNLRHRRLAGRRSGRRNGTVERTRCTSHVRSMTGSPSLLAVGVAWQFRGLWPGAPRAQLLGAAASVGAGARCRHCRTACPVPGAGKRVGDPTLGKGEVRADLRRKRLTRPAAMRLALGDPDDHEIATGGRQQTGPLARREVEGRPLVAEVSATSRSQPGCSFRADGGDACRPHTG